MPYVKNWLARKVSWIITTHNTFFPANDLSHKGSCQTFTFPRTNKCGTILNQAEKKSLHLTTSRYTDEGAESTIRCIRNICSVLNYPPTLFHAEHGEGGWTCIGVTSLAHVTCAICNDPWNFRVRSFRHGVGPYRTICHKIKRFAFLYFLPLCKLITFTIHFVSERHYVLF
jgi:hypothetical protein